MTKSGVTAQAIPGWSIALLLFLTTSGFAGDLTLPAIFSDHMVLQQDQPVPVWGWTAAGTEVTVSINGQTKTAKADANGKWMLRLDPLKGKDPATLTVKGPETITIKDVLIGEVWLCSGQSNMAMTVNRAKDYEKEQAAADLPQIRMFRENSGPKPAPQEQCSGTWTVCAPDTVGSFTATGFFFGRELHQKLSVPVGLINSSVGGTPIESWTSVDVMKDKAEFKPLFERWAQAQVNWDAEKANAQYEKQLAAFKEAQKKAKENGKTTPRAPRKPEEPRASTHNPGNLFNGKIAPLIPYAIHGAIWYQGEANAKDSATSQLYATQLPLLIQDWRTRWGQGDFPFAWVQLPNFKKRMDDPGADSAWAHMRESMLKSLAVKNTGMAIAIDVGEADNIHPKDKQAVGQRLALWALANVYGKEGPSSGPLPAGHRIEGGQVIVSFTHADGGLKAKEGELKGFALAGADKQWHWASARIEGETVIISNPEVKDPVAARYAWGDNPDCNLYNGTGLPATPFRTDTE